METMWRFGSLGVLVVTLAVARNHPAAHLVQPVRAIARTAGGSLPGTAMSMLVPRCHTYQVRGTIGLQTGGAGSIFTTLVLTNVSPRTCSITGYAGVSLVDRVGRQIGSAASWTPSVYHRIVVQPGGAASTMIRTLNPGVGTTNCLPPSTGLRVYPPNERAALFVPVRLSECLGRLEVRPFVAGTAGM